MIFRDVLRTQSNICDGDLFTNIANDGLFSHKSAFVDIRLGSKYVSDINVQSVT